MHDRSVQPQTHAKGPTRPPGTDSGGFSPARLARMHAALRRHVDRGVLPVRPASHAAHVQGVA